MPPKIDFIFFDAGGGHRSAATALEEVIARQRRPWRVRLVNLQEQLDATDLVRRLTGIRTQDCYNGLLRHGWTFGSAQLLKLLHGAIRLTHPAHVRALTRFWKQNTPDMVVSVVPNLNRALYEAFAKANPGAPMVTVLTDLADYPPHFWIERQDQWFVCGTDKAEGQAKHIGIQPEKVLRASGMILRPSFHDPIDVDRRAERLRLDLDPDLPTGLVLFGGQGSKLMLEIARRLQQSERELQLIMICGRNERLAAELRGVESRFPIFVEGFTREIPYYMRLADFFIGKPGPGSISEAIAMNLPVIVQRDFRTLPQEHYNAEWVLENNLGRVIRRIREIGRAVEALLEAESLARYQAAARAIENRAVFEIPDMLEAILNGADPRAA